jgi:hypothetical protein
LRDQFGPKEIKLMIKASGTKGLLRQTQKGAHKENFGIALDIIADKEFGVNDKSLADVLVRQEYKLASEGDLRAIRNVLRIVRANLKGRKETDPGRITRGDFSGPDPEPRNADLAMVILGIAAFDDAALTYRRPEGEDSIDWYVGGLRPTRLERWVLDFAEYEMSDLGAESRRMRLVAAALIDLDRSNVQTWDANRDQIMSQLMVRYGPGATRFKPGVSGNRAGRRRRYAPAYPYDDFLTEAVTLEIKGEVRTMTRLDALLIKLAVMAVTNREIADLVLRLTMQMHELEWNKPKPVNEIIRG